MGEGPTSSIDVAAELPGAACTRSPSNGYPSDLDQSIYALTNLALQMLIAHSVSGEEFGAYSISSTFYFVAALAHQTCLIEPMFVFSGRRYGKHTAAYHRRLRHHWSIGFGALVIVVGLLLSLLVWTFGSSLLAKNLAAFALVSPLLLYFWLLRRMAFVLGRIDIAVLGGTVYAVILLSAAGLLWHASRMSAIAAIGISGLAAVISSAAILRAMRWSLPETLPPADIAYQHFRYGRWAALSEAVNWMIFNGPIVALPIWYGLGAAAQLRILNLLFMPLLQTVSAMTAILLRRYASAGPDGSNMKTVLKFFWMLVAGSATYSIPVAVFGQAVVPVMFGQDHHLQGHWLLFAATSTTCFVASQGFFVFLRAREQSHQVLLVHIAVLTIMVGLLPLAAAYGISGILLAQTIAWGIAIIIAGLLVSKEHRFILTSVSGSKS